MTAFVRFAAGAGVAVVRMKDGTDVADGRLGRLRHFDERSRTWPIRALLPRRDLPLRSYSWATAAPLDQGREGSCVGHAFAHDLAARPQVVSGVTHDDALSIYWRAQQLDPWPGGAYPGASPVYEGTAVLAGAQALVERGYYTEYRWAFGELDAALAIGYRGPIILGIDWHEGMLTPDPDGFIWPTGPVLGGHAILAPAISVRGGYYTLFNSWGPRWGNNGRAKLTREALRALLEHGGEACVPVRRP